MFSRVSRALLLLGALFFGEACIPRPEPPPAPRRYRVDVGDLLLPQWRYVLDCSGLKPQPGGDYGDIEWFLISPGGLGVKNMGSWVSPNKIVIDSAWAGAVWLIQHEMLHHLMQGGADHPVTPFSFPCFLQVGQNLPLPEE